MVCRIGWRLRTEKKGLCKRKALGLCKMVQVHLERFSTNENVFSLRKRRLSLFIQSQPIKESFFCQHTTATISHHTQTNVQHPFSNTACYCELAVHLPFFESQQSCVCCKPPFRTDSNPHRRYPVSLRFPASPVT